MAALMTQITTKSPERRAKIFDLLRDTESTDAPPMPPKYVDAAIAGEMINRALSSFGSPALAPEIRAHAQPSTEGSNRAMMSDMPGMFQTPAQG